MSDPVQDRDRHRGQLLSQIREQLAFLNSLTEAMTQLQNPNQEPNSSTQITSFTSGSLTATIIRGPLDLPFLSEKSGPSPASKASIDAMPRIAVTETAKDCVVCLDEFLVGGEAREMPCKHKFHSGCIEKWLAIHGSCPVCRFVMPVEEEEEEENKSDGEGRERRVMVAFLFTGLGLRGGGGGSGGSHSGLGQETQVDDGSSIQDMES